MIDRQTAHALLAVFAAAVCMPPQIHAARNKIYSCDDASGNRVFQDQPCGTGLKPWERDLTDRTRWSNPVRTGSGCAVRSPTVSLTWLRVDAPITFEGGVALLLNADESGIAATIAVEAAWPQDDQNDVATSNEANGLQAQSATSTFPDSATNAPDGQSAFVVDSMDDPTRMRYGYRQTSTLLRALKRAAALKFRLTLRSPEVSVVSTSMELNGLDAAVDAVTRCAER